MSSWTNDVDGSDSEEDEDATDSEVDQPFPEKLREHVDAEAAGEISELEYVNHVDDVKDEELLRRAWLQLDGERKRVVAGRVERLTGDSPERLDEREPAVESVEDLEDVSPSPENQTDSTASHGVSEQTGGPPTPEDSLSLEEAAQKDRRWKVMVWGPPKLFKTHFCYTMPEPIAFIDLEGKADDLAGKFADKEVRLWQPKGMEANPDTKFRRAKKALDQALDWLDWYWENEGKRGTIAVDSISMLWEWAQVHHKIENYPMKDPDDIDLSANFGSGQESDWAVVKEYHNGEFRERITDSHYHFCWTAMEREEFQETLEDDKSRRFMEPVGEPKNNYKVDTEIRARKDKDRGKVGDLIGSNYVDNMFVGLKKPTFPTVRDAVQRIEQAETSDDSVSRGELASAIGAESIIDYDPQVYVQK